MNRRVRCFIGVGIAGLVDGDGNVLYSPNLPTVRQAALRDEMIKATGCAVIVDNDANVALLGEATYGAAADAQHALLVTLGTGIGGGIYLDGHMYRGAHNFGAEFGHFTVDASGPMCACGERGHWDLAIDGVQMRWTDPVPQAGSYTLTTPFNGKSVSMSFDRVDDDTIQVTVEGPRRSFDFTVSKAGVIAEKE